MDTWMIVVWEENEEAVHTNGWDYVGGFGPYTERQANDTAAAIRNRPTPQSFVEVMPIRKWGT